VIAGYAARTRGVQYIKHLIAAVPATRFIVALSLKETGTAGSASATCKDFLFLSRGRRCFRAKEAGRG